MENRTEVSMDGRINHVVEKKEKHYLYLTHDELRVVMASLVHCKNKLIREGRYTDCIDEMIVKVSRLM